MKYFLANRWNVVSVTRDGDSKVGAIIDDVLGADCSQYADYNHIFKNLKKELLFSKPLQKAFKRESPAYTIKVKNKWIAIVCKSTYTVIVYNVRKLLLVADADKMMSVIKSKVDDVIVHYVPTGLCLCLFL